MVASTASVQTLPSAATSVLTLLFRYVPSKAPTHNSTASVACPLLAVVLISAPKVNRHARLPGSLGSKVWQETATTASIFRPTSSHAVDVLAKAAWTVQVSTALRTSNATRASVSSASARRDFPSSTVAASKEPCQYISIVLRSSSILYSLQRCWSIPQGHCHAVFLCLSRQSRRDSGLPSVFCHGHLPFPQVQTVCLSRCWPVAVLVISSRSLALARSTQTSGSLTVS